MSVFLAPGFGRGRWQQQPVSRGYNRIVRFACAILLLAGLAACNRGNQSGNDAAVRQGVLDHLAQVGLNVGGMDVSFQSIEINGDKATAAVSITAKGGPAGSGMTSKYHLQMKDGKWAYVSRDDGSPHGSGGPGAVAPGSPNPHAGGAIGGAPAAGGKMPSPEDLPPATRKQ
jgi:hypothetical protein